MANSMMCYAGRGLGRERGFTLLEALIAAVILGVGLLAAYRFNSTTIAYSAESNVRAYAIALAEGKLEELRSFQDSDDFDTQVDDGADAAVNYTSSALTRSWEWDEAYGDNPRKIDVTVTWQDKLDDTQTVILSSIIWRNNPGKDAKDLFLALNSNGNSVDGFGDANGLEVKGAGEDGGTVIITDETKLDPAGYVGEGESTNTADYWDIELSGDILFTDEGLSGVAIAGGPDFEAECDIVASVAYAPEPGGLVLDDDGNEVVLNGSTILATAGNQVYESGAYLDDVYGVAVLYTTGVQTPLDDGTRYVGKYSGEGDSLQLLYHEVSLIVLPGGAGGSMYRCEINGVPDGSSWIGTLTYTAAGNDGVCIPDNRSHSVEITVSNAQGYETTSLDNIAVVVMKNSGSCPAIVR